VEFQLEVGLGKNAKILTEKIAKAKTVNALQAGALSSNPSTTNKNKKEKRTSFIFHILLIV
jgi:hypothetical protein